MAQPTKPYKNTFSGSVGAGVGSLFNPNKRRYYILEHKVSSKYHKAGSTQEIIVDQIEIGRDSRCQVRFDESFRTVSRHHAAIVKDGDNWKLVQISQNNSTLLNGHPVKTEWYLQNGDEIQLSINGPKLGFIIPTGNKATVGSIGMTKRLSLFRQQALRPYKYAITTLSCLLVLAIGVGSYFLTLSYNENQKLSAVVEKQKKEMEKIRKDNKAVLDSVQRTNEDMKKQIANFAKSGARRGGGGTYVPRRIIIPKATPSPNDQGTIESKSKPSPTKIEACMKDVYFIYTSDFQIVTPDGQTFSYSLGEKGFPGWVGTGFILNDGRFITARHVIEGWSFWEGNKTLQQMNAFMNNGGSVICNFVATSSSGKQISFSSKQFTMNRSHDQYARAEDGTKYSMAPLDNTDYAYAYLSVSGSLVADKQKSNSLERGTQLTVLGFPLSIGGSNNPDKVSPKYSQAICADNGLTDGVILTTGTTYEKGNSGGPVFCSDSKGNLTVIGIVSAGSGRSTGFVVPISQIK